MSGAGRWPILFAYPTLLGFPPRPRMPMRTGRCIVLLIVTALPASAQSLAPRVIATGGDVVTQQTISLSFTIGEAATASLSAPGILLTEGFQQNDPVKQGVEEEGAALPSSDAFPLPASTRVALAFPGAPEKVRVVNVLGATLEGIALNIDGAHNRVIVDVGRLVPGRYVCEARVPSGNATRVVRRVFVVAR